MSILYYGINTHTSGIDNAVLTVGSTTSKAVQIVIDNTKATNEAEVVQCVEQLLVYIQQKRLQTT